MKIAKIIISVSLGLAIIACVVFFSFLRTSTNNHIDVINRMEQIKTENGTPVNINHSFENDKEKYHNDEIKTIDFLKANRIDYVYEGIHFVSKADFVDDEKMQEIADELFANTHSDEIRYLKAVEIEEGSGVICTSSCDHSYTPYEIPISLYGFLPEENIFNSMYMQSYITIHGVAEFTEVEEFAQPLSTAYGHHFVQYHFGLKGTEEDKDTEYYKIRAEGDDRVLFEVKDNDEYKANKIWYLKEIAANDYMFFMGSDKAHRIIDVDKRRKETLYNFQYNTFYYDINDDKYTWNQWSRNVTPHANMVIDIPNIVDGLAEYFYDFVDAETPTYTEIKDLEKINLRLNSRDSYHGYQWDMPYKEEGVIYTLVVYDGYDNVVTALFDLFSHNGSTPHARIPKIREYLWWLKLEEGTKIRARVIVTFPDKTVAVTDCIEIEFEEHYLR